MNSFYAFDVKANLLSATVRLTRTVQTEFTLSGVKAEKAVLRKRLLFVGLQADHVPIKCSNRVHIFDEQYDTSYIHLTAPNPMTRSERFTLFGNAPTF